MYVASECVWFMKDGRNTAITQSSNENM